MLKRGANLTPIIEVKQLQQKYGGFSAVNGINFAVYPGEIFGLIGTNGAGKTSTLEILAGVRTCSMGKVTILGKDPHQIRKKIGYLTQKFSLYLDLSIDENIRYSAKIRGVNEKDFWERRTHYLKLMDLEKVSHRLARNISGGMKQKLSLCCVMITHPKILLLDELSSGIDIISRREIWNLLVNIANEEDVTIIVATHYLDEAERCNRVALLHEGKIQQIGTPEQLRKDLGLYCLEVLPGDDEISEMMEEILKRSCFNDSSVIHDVQTFGDCIEVLVRDPYRGEMEIRRVLLEHSLRPEKIEQIPIKLENVMVNKLRSESARYHQPIFLHHHLNGDLPYSHSHALVLKAENLSKSFADYNVIEDISLTLKQGEICGLLGANGAGKTTLIKILSGLMFGDTGEVLISDQSGFLKKPELVKSNIGYMSQKFTLYPNLTILENLIFFARAYKIPKNQRRERIDHILNIFGLSEKINKQVGQLSGGNQQKVAFGAAIMHRPKLIFLDEPTTGMDILAHRQFWDLLQDIVRHGSCVLITTHSLEEAEYCSRLVFMRDGKLIAQGSPHHIKQEQDGALIEIRSEDLQKTLKLLRNQLETWQIFLFGECFQILLKMPEIEIPRIRDELDAYELSPYSLRLVPFSLEAAFVNLIHRRSQ